MQFSKPELQLLTLVFLQLLHLMLLHTVNNATVDIPTTTTVPAIIDTATTITVCNKIISA